MFQVRVIAFNGYGTRDHIQTVACVSRKPTTLPLVLLLPLTLLHSHSNLTTITLLGSRNKNYIDVAELQQKIKNKNSEMQLMKRMEDLVLWRRNHLQQK